MGSSATAAIFYGIPIGDEGTDTDDLADSYLTAIGVNLDDATACVNALRHIDFTYDGCSNSGATRPFLVIPESLQITDWSEALEIDVDKLKVGSDWNQKLRDFCNKAGIEFTEPKFLLIASYG